MHCHPCSARAQPLVLASVHRTWRGSPSVKNHTQSGLFRAHSGVCGHLCDQGDDSLLSLLFPPVLALFALKNHRVQQIEPIDQVQLVD